MQGFNSNIRKNFTSHLAPYRDQNKRYNRAFFYLISTSLATKEPLPHQLPTMIATARSSLQHDALVLSSRLYKSEEGRDVLHSQEFGESLLNIELLAQLAFRALRQRLTSKSW